MVAWGGLQIHPAMSRYRDAQLRSPSPDAIPAFAHAFRSRVASSLPAMSRCRDAQLPSPSAPMQSKTVALAPMVRAKMKELGLTAGKKNDAR